MVAAELKKVTTKLASKMKEREKKKKRKAGKDDSSSDFDEDSFANMMMKIWLCPITNTIPRNPVNPKTLVLASNIHNVDQNCGIDTDAGMSITEWTVSPVRNKRGSIENWRNRTDDHQDKNRGDHC
jgi:hypothetical protein